MKPAICASCRVILLLVFAPFSSEACTLWAAAGARVSGGGTLIAKNRDKNPAEVNTLEIVIPKDSPELYVKLANSGETDKVYRLTMDPRFCAGAKQGPIDQKQAGIR
ncbi:MAG: hypothetical protein NTZ78_14280 [Candidatus Aureabacteria bacterium]|nr:hypothetical protein [Candidatus Auribacterota bacterium]